MFCRILISLPGNKSLSLLKYVYSFSNTNLCQAELCYLLGKKMKTTHEEIFGNTGLSAFLADLAPETLATHFSSYLEEPGGQVL